MSTLLDSVYPFPEIVEIWDIISSYSTSKTLKSLCLVGRRALVSAAQRYLFRNMISNITTLVSRGPYAQPGGHETDNIPWFDELAESHLSRHVKSWTIKGEDEFIYDVSYFKELAPVERNAALSALLRSVPRFPNLSALRVESLTLYKSTLSLIGFISNLKSLEFRNISGPFPLTLAVPLALEEFKFDINGDFCYYDGAGGTKWTISSPGSLKSLSLKHRLAHHNKYTNVVGRALYHHLPHTNLVSLLFTVSEQSGKACLIRLLTASPLLETLTVIFPGSLEDDKEKLQESWEDVVLDRSVCPLLRDVTCCPQLAKVILPGKPVTTFSMRTNNNYWNKYKFTDVSSALRVTSLDGINLTTLQFERTLAREAEEFLPLVEMLFPGLKTLKMAVKDVADDIYTENNLIRLRNAGRLPPGRNVPSDEEYDRYVNNTSNDAKSIRDPDDIRQAEKQFNNCFDNDYYSKHVAPCAHKALQDHVHSYVGLLSKVTSGRIKLPKGLTNLELTQSRLHKRYSYTWDHERMFAMALTHPRFEKLELVKFGADNAYNMPWQRTSSETWKKPGCFFRRNWHTFFCTMYIIPVESDETHEMVKKEEMEVEV